MFLFESRLSRDLFGKSCDPNFWIFFGQALACSPSPSISHPPLTLLRQRQRADISYPEYEQKAEVCRSCTLLVDAECRSPSGRRHVHQMPTPNEIKSAKTNTFPLIILKGKKTPSRNITILLPLHPLIKLNIYCHAIGLGYDGMRNLYHS